MKANYVNALVVVCFTKTPHKYAAVVGYMGIILAFTLSLKREWAFIGLLFTAYRMVLS